MIKERYSALLKCVCYDPDHIINVDVSEAIIPKSRSVTLSMDARIDDIENRPLIWRLKQALRIIFKKNLQNYISWETEYEFIDSSDKYSIEDDDRDLIQVEKLQKAIDTYKKIREEIRAEKLAKAKLHER